MAIHHRNNKRNTFLVGAAVAAGLVGTLTTLFWPKRKRGWTEQARDRADRLARSMHSWTRNSRETLTKNFMMGSVAGSIIGASTALLFAPKAGRDLVRDLSKPFGFNSSSRKKQTSRPKAARKAKAVRAAVREARHVVAAKPKRVAQRRNAHAMHHSHAQNNSTRRPSRAKASSSRRYR